MPAHFYPGLHWCSHNFEMAAVVPYVSRYTIPAMAGMLRYNKYKRTAGAKIANFLYRKTRRYVKKRAVAYASRAMGSWKKRARLMIGEKVGTGGSKRNNIRDVDETYDTRTLYRHDVCDLEKGDAIDARLRDIVNLRGFKLCWTIKNKLQVPMHMNVACVVPKRQTEFVLAPKESFFRNTGQTRGLDFDPAILSANDFRCRPINSDRYKVMWHIRTTLASVDEEQVSVDFNDGTRSSYKMLDRYTPIKRQVRFNQGTANDNPEGSSAHLVYWFDTLLAKPGDPVSVAALEGQMRLTTYFREPKN